MEYKLARAFIEKTDLFSIVEAVETRSKNFSEDINNCLVAMKGKINRIMEKKFETIQELTETEENEPEIPTIGGQRVEGNIDSYPAPNGGIRASRSKSKKRERKAFSFQAEKKTPNPTLPKLEERKR